MHVSVVIFCLIIVSYGHEYDFQINPCNFDLNEQQSENLELRCVPKTFRPFYGMGIQEAWLMNYTGEGVCVAVVDNGVDMGHKDLTKNLDKILSHSFDSKSTSVNPKRYYSYPETDEKTSHGTMAAGLIGAELGNGCCSDGVAFNTKLVALRALIIPDFAGHNGILSNIYSSEKIPEALEYRRDTIDVYSNSYTFDKKYVKIPNLSDVLREGIRKGRNGKGSIFVFSAGNRDNRKLYDCNMDPFANSIYTITITSVGKNGISPDFAIPCACSLASTFGIYTTLEGDTKLLTTTHDNDCANFTGTSASAAVASGIIALALQANPDLTWRDVQHLIVLTSSDKNLVKNETVQNAIGLFHSPYFGFGLMNAAEMVKMAQTWKTVPPQINSSVSVHQIMSPDSRIDIYWNVTDSRIESLEHVTVTLNYETSCEDAIKMILCSPSGTCCNILHSKTKEIEKESFDSKWTYMTVTFWGESSQGEWKLSITEDTGTKGVTTSVKEATLNMYGTDGNNIDSRCGNEGENDSENSAENNKESAENVHDEGREVSADNSSYSLSETGLLLAVFCVFIIYFICHVYAPLLLYTSRGPFYT